MDCMLTSATFAADTPSPPLLAQELAVMVARSRTGGTQSFPVVETIQKNSICHVTEAPAQISSAAQDKAAAVAEQAVATLEGKPCTHTLFITSLRDAQDVVCRRRSD